MFTIVIREIPGNWQTPEIIRLRHFLKSAKRAWGFQSVDIREHSQLCAVQGTRNERAGPGVSTADPIDKMRPGANDEDPSYEFR
ncbi:MAG TPA: hypothetical protein VKY92_28190 [Verrucomicrobiae bacterium]|nr:hypothetical protein [Verrucomicrobiae bacterium]